MKSLILTIALLASVDASARQRYTQQSQTTATARAIARTKALVASVTAYATDSSIPSATSNPGNLIVNPSLSKDACLGNAASQTGTVLSGHIFVDELIGAQRMTDGEVRPPRVVGTCYGPNSGLVYENTDRLDCMAYGSGTYCAPSASAWDTANREYEARFGGSDGLVNGAASVNCLELYASAWLLYRGNVCYQLAHANQFGGATCGQQIVNLNRALLDPVTGAQRFPDFGASCGY